MKKLIYFTAAWCGPCRFFSPIMEEVHRGGINVEKVDIDERKDVAQFYNIRNVPTLILIDQFGKEIKRRVGACSKEEVIRFVNS